MSRKSYMVISVVSFIVSAYFTILLFKSSSVGLFDAIPMVAVAIIFEFSKWCLLKESIVGQHRGPMKTVIFSLWAFTTLASIIASAGYVLNQSNGTKNINMESSTAYQNQIQARNNQADLYAIKKQELNNLIQTKDTNLKDLAKSRDSLPRDYITAKENYNIRINQATEKLDTLINTKSSELTSISSNLQNPIKVDANVLPTSGYAAVFQLAADFLNNNDTSAKKNPYHAEVMELWFFLVLGVGIELLANVFAYLAQVSTNDIAVKKEPSSHGLVPTQTLLPSNVVDIRNREPKEKIQGNKIDFKAVQAQEFDEADMKKYVEYMRQNEKNGYSPGYKSIAANIGIGVEVARSIKNRLERDRVIVVDGNRTKII